MPSVGDAHSHYSGNASTIHNVITEKKADAIPDKTPTVNAATDVTTMF